MVLKTLLDAQGRGHTLDLLSDYCLWLYVQKVIKLEVEIGLAKGSTLVLVVQLCMRFAHKRKVTVCVEVVIVFDKKHVLSVGSFLLREVFDHLKVDRFEIPLLELHENKVTLFELPEPLQKHPQILFDILRCLTVDLRSDSVNIFNVSSFECLQELVIVSSGPVAKASLQHR